MNIIFDRSKHVFHSDAFAEIIKDTIRFFNGTPVQYLPPQEDFSGTGVYALYYIGRSKYYQVLYEQNRTGYNQPIYVGKAVPRGWRQGRNRNGEGHELYSRLCDHQHSIEAVKNLSLKDFMCRFMILEGAEADLIGAVEAALIRTYAPVWNSCIDGFGNHDPGSGRYNQARSDWDVLHKGRAWADKCLGKALTLKAVEHKVQSFFTHQDETDDNK